MELYQLKGQYRFRLAEISDCTAPALDGPHLSNERTPEQWTYARFHTQFGIYQFGCERKVRPNLTVSPDVVYAESTVNN